MTPVKFHFRSGKTPACGLALLLLSLICNSCAHSIKEPLPASSNVDDVANKAYYEAGFQKSGFTLSDTQQAVLSAKNYWEMQNDQGVRGVGPASSMDQTAELSDNGLIGLAMTSGKVVLDSTPEDAEVMIDNHYSAENTDSAVWLQQGLHTIIFEKEGYKTVTRACLVKAMRINYVKVDLQRH